MRGQPYYCKHLYACLAVKNQERSVDKLLLLYWNSVPKIPEVLSCDFPVIATDRDRNVSEMPIINMLLEMSHPASEEELQNFKTGGNLSIHNEISLAKEFTIGRPAQRRAHNGGFRSVTVSQPSSPLVKPQGNTGDPYRPKVHFPKTGKQPNDTFDYQGGRKRIKPTSRGKNMSAHIEECSQDFAKAVKEVQDNSNKGKHRELGNKLKRKAIARPVNSDKIGEQSTQQIVNTVETIVDMSVNKKIRLDQETVAIPVTFISGAQLKPNLKKNRLAGQKVRFLNTNNLLSNEHMAALSTNTWLNDEHMNAANGILRARFPTAGGLCDTILQQNNSQNVPTSEYVQFLHVADSHWVTISNLGLDTMHTVLIYDSLQQQPDRAFITLVSKFLHLPEKQIDLKIMNVQKQPNSHDCGVYSIAFATSLLNGEDPTHLQYETTARKHLKQCFLAASLTPFPSSVNLRVPRYLHTTRGEELHCDCRKPDDGKLMVECEGCSVWYHGACVRIRSVRASRGWKCQSCR
jgi:hypothetical protein